MRCVPVRVCSPFWQLRKAAINRMAVPAARTSMFFGMSESARTITRVSSQFDRFCGSIELPDRACIMSALLLMLFEAGSVTTTLSFSGATIEYCIYK